MLQSKNCKYPSFSTTTWSTVMENHRRYRSERKHPESTLLKRVPLHRLMDLKIDYAFKQIFGQEKNKQITVVFLNSFLQKTGHPPITEIYFDNVEETAEYDGDKESRLDILAVTKDGKRINIEIQLTHSHHMVKRSLYYWSGVYRRPMKEGMAFEELNPVISINILNFNTFPETERFHTMYHLYEDEEKFQLTDVMEFHFVEMPKLIKAWKENKLDPWNDVLARWLLLLGVVDRRNGRVNEDILKELEAIAMTDEVLRESMHAWTELSMNDKEYAYYEARLKRVLDEAAAKRSLELREEEMQREMEKQQKKMEKQQEEMEKQQKEIEASQNRVQKAVFAFFQNGFTVEAIMEMMDLSKEEVMEIKQSMEEK